MIEYDAALTAILVEECGCSPSAVRSSARLVEDLRIDGDDAAELFAALTERFGANFKRLDAAWESYFRPKATSWRNRLASWSCVLGGTLLAMSLHVSPVWGVLFCLALVALRTWELLKSPRESTSPVRVSDVALALERGAWLVPDPAGSSHALRSSPRDNRLPVVV